MDERPSWPRCPLCDPESRRGPVPKVREDEPCPECGGSGVLGSVGGTALDCPICGGTGVVPIAEDGPCPMCDDEQVVSPEDFAAWALARAGEVP